MLANSRDTSERVASWDRSDVVATVTTRNLDMHGADCERLGGRMVDPAAAVMLLRQTRRSQGGVPVAVRLRDGGSQPPGAPPAPRSGVRLGSESLARGLP